MISMEAPGSQLLLLGLTLYFSGAVVLTLKATIFFVTFVNTIRVFFSPDSMLPKYNSSAGLMCNKGPLKTLNGFLKVFVFESTFSFSSFFGNRLSWVTLFRQS